MSDVTDQNIIEAMQREIDKLEAQLEDVISIGYDTHPSWNCSEEFNSGWNACRKQVDKAIDTPPQESSSE